MRLISLVFIAVLTFVIVLMVKRPELLKDFWLWLIGFSGLILHGLQSVGNYFKGLYNKTSASLQEKEKEIASKIKAKKN
jgi:hypothetical protein